MAKATTSGRDIRIWTFSVTTSGSTIVLNQRVNSLIIQCRTPEDIYLRESGGAGDYFTIKAGNAFTLDVQTSDLQPIHLTSASTTVTVEIIGFIE